MLDFSRLSPHQFNWLFTYEVSIFQLNFFTLPFIRGTVKAVVFRPIRTSECFEPRLLQQKFRVFYRCGKCCIFRDSGDVNWLCRIWGNICVFLLAWYWIFLASFLIAIKSSFDRTDFSQLGFYDVFKLALIYMIIAIVCLKVLWNFIIDSYALQRRQLRITEQLRAFSYFSLPCIVMMCARLVDILDHRKKIFRLWCFNLNIISFMTRFYLELSLPHLS